MASLWKPKTSTIINVLDKTKTSHPKILVCSKGDVFKFSTKLFDRVFLVFIMQDGAKLDEHFCSHWPKATLKPPKKSSPIQLADAHTIYWQQHFCLPLKLFYKEC